MPKSPSYLEAPSGTRDFYPADMRQRNWLFVQFRECARLLDFEEYDTPIMENVELFQRKAGEAFGKQLYQFADGDGNQVALRPEMTASLARLVLNRTNLQTGNTREKLPLKWYSISPCWRFETTQRGRRREFYQWNMDIVGVDNVSAEAELMAAAVQFFRRVNLTSREVCIRVNSRAVLEQVLAKYGICKGEAATNGGGDDDQSDMFTETCIIIDKFDKIGKQQVQEQLEGIGVSTQVAQDILCALKSPSIDALAKCIGEQDSAAFQEIRELFKLAEAYGIQDYLVFDAKIVRGLAYYTGIVWEAFDCLGQNGTNVLRAVMGGGRYDNLLSSYGGPACQMPCVGFGLGDCVIVELLKMCNKLPNFAPPAAVDYAVCAFGADMYGTAVQVATQLRSLGRTVNLMPPGTKKIKLKKIFDYTDQVGANRLVLVAQGEVDQGLVRVKELRKVNRVTGKGGQVDCPLDQLDQLDKLFDKAAANSNVAQLLL